MKNVITLISKLNIKEVPNKNSRKNRNRNFYFWKLERFIKNVKNDIEVDVFPSSPENTNIQNIKDKLIFEINNLNIFDFEYLPMEKDYLNIVNKKNNNDYLNIIYLNGKWIEEYHTCSKRSFFDIYSEIENGEFELI